MRIVENIGLSFNDVLLVPNYSEIESRGEVQLTTEVAKGLSIDVPIISANMDSVTEAEMAETVAEFGGIGVLHRYLDVQGQVGMIKQVLSKGHNVGAAIGVVGDWFNRATALIDAGVNLIVVDVAHGDHRLVCNVLEKLGTVKGGIPIMAGNIATGEAAKRLIDAGADALKVGIGPGCEAAGTRVLMANGTYKDIEEIKTGDRVINGKGLPVTVNGTRYSGKRQVYRIRHTQFYRDNYVTGDHLYWVGDLNSVNKKTLAKKSYAGLLTQDSKTTPKLSKFKWKAIEDIQQDVMLLPTNIVFEQPQELSIDTSMFLKSRHSKRGTVIINASYGLGYIFGTFLGDGTASNSQVRWTFGKEEDAIATKLQGIIYNVTNITASLRNCDNTIQVTLSSKKWAQLLQEFGKRSDKSLPEKYICANTGYKQGIYDGLLDSDGHISKDGRECFKNTSPKLIELFSVLCKEINGSFPNNEEHLITAGGINANIENSRTPYGVRLNSSHKKRHVKGYQVVKILERNHTPIYVDTYDIEVDCPSHSFIANNAVVHNSFCTTRLEAGAGVPQITAISNVSSVAKKHGVKICADGGIKFAGDIVKALGAGADTVMIGRLLAATDQAPGNFVHMGYGETKAIYKQYRGMASFDAKIQNNMQGNNVEGMANMVKYQGDASQILRSLIDGVRSGFSYAGARSIEEMHEKATFIQITSSAEHLNKVSM